MKAEIILENIGQYKGIKKYFLESGFITLFQGRNSLGKTTIIKSIAAALSPPIESENLIHEANKFGILPRKGQKAPLVNFDEENAKIILKYDSEIIETTIHKDGRINSNFKGNEIFLYSCMLFKNSKIQEHLASGDYNFSWIVSEMSNAGKYEELKENIDSYKRLNDLAKALLEDINEKIGNYITEINEFTEKKEEIEPKLKKVQDEIENMDLSQFPEYQKLKKDEEKKKEDLKKTKPQLETAEKNAKKIEKEMSGYDSEINSLNNQLKEDEKYIKDIKKKIKVLSETPTDDLKNIIIKKQEELPPLSEELGKNKSYKDIFHNIKQAKIESDECIICGSNIKLTQVQVEKKIKDLKVKIDGILTKKHEIDVEIETAKNKISEAEKLPTEKTKLKNANKSINAASKTIDDLKRKKQDVQGKVKKAQGDVTLVTQQIMDLTAEIEKIKEEMMDYAKNVKELNVLEEKKRKLEKEIKDLEVSIGKNKELVKENSEIELFNIKIPIEKADGIIDKMSTELKEINNFLNDNINEQRKGAAKKFNSSIKNVIQELNLANFENISIDLNDFSLKIINKGGKVQPHGSLGGAEKGIIGGILQISCKQTYLPDIPFFVGDDIILDFDPENAEKFMNYLKKIAQDEDIFIVMTKPTTDTSITKIQI